MRALSAAMGLIVILAAGAGGLYLTDRLLAGQEPGARQDGFPAGGGEAVRVETVPLQRARFTQTIRAVGTARAIRAIELTPESGGRIVRIAFAPGDEVAAGDILLELDDRTEQAAFRAAEATLAEAEAAFSRQQTCLLYTSPSPRD